MKICKLLGHKWALGGLVSGNGKHYGLFFCSRCREMHGSEFIVTETLAGRKGVRNVVGKNK